MIKKKVKFNILKYALDGLKYGPEPSSDDDAKSLKNFW